MRRDQIGLALSMARRDIAFRVLNLVCRTVGHRVRWYTYGHYWTDRGHRRDKRGCECSRCGIGHHDVFEESLAGWLRGLPRSLRASMRTLGRRPAPSAIDLDDEVPF